MLVFLYVSTGLRLFFNFALKAILLSKRYSLYLFLVRGPSGGLVFPSGGRFVLAVLGVYSLGAPLQTYAFSWGLFWRSLTFLDLLWHLSFPVAPLMARSLRRLQSPSGPPGCWAVTPADSPLHVNLSTVSEPHQVTPCTDPCLRISCPQLEFTLHIFYYWKHTLWGLYSGMIFIFLDNFTYYKAHCVIETVITTSTDTNCGLCMYKLNVRHSISPLLAKSFIISKHPKRFRPFACSLHSLWW